MEAAREKFFENLKNRLDSHDKLWYPVVTARLVKSNQGCGGLLQGPRKGSKFLHSILSFSGRVQCFMVCSAPPARQRQLLVRRPLQTARKQKRDPSLDHRWIPIFVCFLSKTMLYWSRSLWTARGVATNVGGKTLLTEPHGFTYLSKQASGGRLF